MKKKIPKDKTNSEEPVIYLNDAPKFKRGDILFPVHGCLDSHLYSYEILKVNKKTYGFAVHHKDGFTRSADQKANIVDTNLDFRLATDIEISKTVSTRIIGSSKLLTDTMSSLLTGKY